MRHLTGRDKILYDSATPAVRFLPLHFGWAAVPQEPRCLVILVGGAFFGTFPTFFYRALLQRLHDRGCAVVALPFRFSFRHWDIALSLADYQSELRDEIAALIPLPATGLPTVWIGHSLGCKYIALIELLSDAEQPRFDAAMEHCLRPTERLALERRLPDLDLARLSLIDQPSILLDPVISDLDNAVPIPPLRRLLERWLRVWPSRSESFCLVERSRLFQLTSILSFGSAMSRATVKVLEALPRQPWLERINLLGKRHLAVLGLRQIDADILSGVETLLDHSLPRAVAPAAPPLPR